MSMTEPTRTEVEHSKRAMRAWAVVGLMAVTATVTGAIVYGFTSKNEVVAYRDSVNYANNELLPPLCDAAGSRVTDSDAQRACINISHGKPAIALPSTAAAQPSADDVGISYSRQLDRCYVEIGLTNGVRQRFGPLCGAQGKRGKAGKTGKTGATGPSGIPGVSGQDGENGQDAPPPVGIREVRTSGCMVDVVFTDESVQTVGPFCGPTPTEQTRVYPDGSEERCTRAGGSDTAPRYNCAVTAPTTESSSDTPALPLPTG